MIQRTTLQGVKDIYTGSGATDAEIGAAISIANVFVESKLVGKTGVDESILPTIETLLSAHFLVINLEKGGLAREVIGQTSDTYNVRKDSGLRSTRYGQQAAALDPSGTLLALGGTKASFEVFPIALTKTG